MSSTAIRPALPTTEPRPAAGDAGAGDAWWRDAVTYQVYIRSFADADGDGMGDVAGIRSRLDYLADLGIDALWINPWYPSPQADAGYDVADYRDLDPAFGTLAEAQELIDEAHALGIRVLLDIVPNHTSDEHPWFTEAVSAGPGSHQRARYLFRPGRGISSEVPPNDWKSIFGGPGWTRITEPDGTLGEWYLHLFDRKQPDLNWDNPVVRDEFEQILRFWFDRGVDGFRIDVAHGLVKDPTLPDLDDHPHRSEKDGGGAGGRDGEEASHLLDAADRSNHPHWDRPGVHEIYRAWRKVAESYHPARVFVAEAWVASPQRLAAYLRPDELHTAFDFDFVTAPWNAPALRETAMSSLHAHDSVGAPVMWVLSNHDITRHVTRLGRPSADRARDPLHGHDTEPSDVALGRRRARAALLLELALPGGVYLYQGEELGLEEVEDLPDEVRQDPVWLRSNHTERGRDGCRVPFPWKASGPSLGFGEAAGWLPQPTGWAGPDGLSAEAQDGDPSSMLTFYRTALRLRRELVAAGTLGAGGGASLTWLDADRLDADADQLVAFRREAGLACVLNAGLSPAHLPAELAGARVLLASGPIEPGVLPADTAVWLATD